MNDTIYRYDGTDYEYLEDVVTDLDLWDEMDEWLNDNYTAAEILRMCVFDGATAESFNEMFLNYIRANLREYGIEEAEVEDEE